MKSLLFLLLLACGGWAAAAAEAQIVVQKKAGQKSSVDLSELAAGGDAAAQTFRRTLESDLVRSGWFIKAPAGQGEFTVSGRVDADGQLRAECRVLGRADRRSYLAKAYTGTPERARRLAHQVADEIIEALTGKKGMASARLALVGTATGSKELYLCDADGQNLVQLTRDKTGAVGPKWNRAGTRLVYMSYLKSFPDVWMIDVASGNRQRVSGHPGLNAGAAFSPDGSEIALILSKDGNPELYIKNLSSGALTRLTNTPKAAEASPTWSPDGSQICFASDAAGLGRPQLYVVGRGGGAPRRLTTAGSQNVDPDWGANGLIAYSSLQGRFQVFIMDPNTLQSKQVSPGGDDFEDPSWAPDGRHIACGRSRGYKSQVWLLDTLGDPPLPLTDQPGDWYSPAWSSK